MHSHHCSWTFLSLYLKDTTHSADTVASIWQILPIPWNIFQAAAKSLSPRLKYMYKVIHPFFGQPFPVSHHCLVKNFSLMSNLNLSSFRLKPFPLVLSDCVKAFFLSSLKVLEGCDEVSTEASPGWTTSGPSACPHRRGGPAFWATSWLKYFDII